MTGSGRAMTPAAIAARRDVRALAVPSAPTAPARPRRRSLARTARRAGVALVGGAVVLAGLLLVPLPGPGWAVVFLGLALLGREFPCAARLSGALQRRLRRLTSWLRGLARTARTGLQRARETDGGTGWRRPSGGEAGDVPMTVVPDRPAGRHVSWSSAPLAIVTLLVMLFAVGLREGTGRFTYPGWPLLMFTVLAWLPLVVRTRWPLKVLVATVVVHAAQLLLLPQLDPDLPAVGMGAYQPVPVATMVAAFTVAMRLPRRTAWLAGGVASLVLPLAAVIGQPDDLLLTNVVMCNLVLDGTAAGALIAGRRDRLEQEARERAEDTRRAVESERLRIAAELHDVLAHHLTLVNAKAGVADYLLDSDPHAARTALQGLSRHTGQALDELRATVGLLRYGHDTAAGDGDEAAQHKPMPGLDRLPELVDAVRSAGTVVDLRADGNPRPLTASADLAAYRIVQESLTNATKHAPGTKVTVTLGWTDERLRLRVENPAPAERRPPGAGTGHGLIGMQERARAAGGTVIADHTDAGGFAVAADLPAARGTGPTTQEKP